MSKIDPIFAEVTAPGTPFELGEQDGLRFFVNAPSDLNQLIESARRFGDQTCVVDYDGPEGERRLSFAAMFEWRDRLAGQLGIGRGQRVAICMRNRAEWMVAFLAVVRLGGVAALLNSRGSAAELSAMVDEVTPDLVLADTERAALLRDGGYEGRLIDVTQPLGDDTPVLANSAAAEPSDPCAILFTSGTTGRVKGAVLSHRSLITGLLGTQLTGSMVLHNMAREYGVPVDAIVAQVPPQAILLVYPLFHISGLGAGFLAPFLSGGKIVIMRRWEADEAVRLIEHEWVTQLSTVPTMLWDMVHRARAGDADLSSVRNIGSGGQALPLNLLEEVRALCPHAMIGVGYGMTETSGAIAQAVGSDFLARRASAGRVLPLVDLRVEREDGTLCGSNDTGEIIVRSAMIMSGYWNRPEETSRTFTADGWLRTGDIGYQDEEGYIFIVDRAKDMVISAGENIYCAEVERVLSEMPQITECATFGIADDRLGEALVAVVQADGLDERSIIDWVAGRLAPYKAPVRVAFSRDPLPRNHSQKIDKIALRSLWPKLAAKH
ncbi:class I adenylate-forming enzyme family protein [Sphingobium vermicomposti]|uniref:Acyl-CoA synthetase (AMP-forming)/AMP-acid ligase II n=1 Tax=Sphingobium vermicomposti TaxID=529005 RepID=A0A846MCC9_9SPHN|nr:class I adenylate-forming enzyme family protein [Sphingobium vermicomposti]NIJ18270.1 acyl-CoA synthetase (AMP-forming)/AMP-acid ligase II [Sphingobium vermicomposti]